MGLYWGTLAGINFVALMFGCVLNDHTLVLISGGMFLYCMYRFGQEVSF